MSDVKEQSLKGMKVGDKTFKVHLDGDNITDALAGKSPSPREGGVSASLRRPQLRRVGSHMPVAVDRETDGRGAEGPIGRARTSGT
jgi:hypothetical protein